jgi:hypothetical protein
VSQHYCFYPTDPRAREIRINHLYPTAKGGIMATKTKGSSGGIRTNQLLGGAVLLLAGWVAIKGMAGANDGNGGSGSAVPTVADIRAATTKEANQALRDKFEAAYGQELIDYPTYQALYCEFIKQSYYLDLYLRGGGWVAAATDFRNRVAGITDVNLVYPIYQEVYNEHINNGGGSSGGGDDGGTPTATFSGLTVVNYS